jgi:anti-anti-sigma factor
MKYTVDKRDKFTILSIEEENLNSVVAPTLKSDLVIMKNEGVQYLVVDLSKVSYIDSSGLSAILVGDRLWKGEGAFILTGVNQPAVKKLLEISRLDSILEMIPTVEEAKEYVYMLELEREISQEEE